MFFQKEQLLVPAQAKITSSKLCQTTDKNFSGFSIIVEADENSEKQVLMSPDIAICADCSCELHDTTNRRFRYPFITCTQCGPRYSIARSLPYERHGTSMEIFSMCKNCNDEYRDVANRRSYSQTNSCADCGV